MLLCRAVFSLTRSLQHFNYSMELKEAVAVLDGLAAPSLAESWDNVGLLLQPYTQREVKTVFLTNDLSEDVMAEAVEQKADLILSYHPPLFRPFKRITTGWKDRIIACCLEKGIAVYSPHTAYDTLKGGVNDWLLKAFDVQGVTPLQQKDVSPPYSHQVEANSAHVPAAEDFVQKVTREFGERVSVVSNGGKCVKVLCGEQALPTIVNLANRTPEPPKLVVTKLEKVPLFEHGAGRRAGLRESITIQEAISRVKTHLGLPHIRVAVAQGSKLDSQVKTVAVCAGSGASVLRGAAADLWLTGEMSHHEVLDAAHNGTTVILVDHSNSERGFLKEELQPTLHQLFAGKVNVLISQQDRDPLQVL